MEITINGNVIINTAEATKATKTTENNQVTDTTKPSEMQAHEGQQVHEGQHAHEGQQAHEEQPARKPIDRTKEVLISNETCFSDLIRILRKKPEAVAAAAALSVEKKYKLMFGESKAHGADEVTEKTKRCPGLAALRMYVPMVAKIEFPSGGYCEVFSNGYAIYDNGNRKCVVWVPDCGHATYYFGSMIDNEKDHVNQKKELSEDDLGPLPWYHAVIMGGEDRIERNMARPKSNGSDSDTKKPEEWELKSNFRWSCGSHFDTPEEAYLKKEAAEERCKSLTEKQKEAYVLYYEKGYTQEEIAEMIGISQQSVMDRLNGAVRKFGKDTEKYF